MEGTKAKLLYIIIHPLITNSPTLAIDECIYYIQQIRLYWVLEIELHSTWPRVSDNIVAISLSFNLSANTQYSFVDFELLTCLAYVFNNVSSRPIASSYVAAECQKEYTCFPFISIMFSNFFNLSETWPLLVGIVISSFHHNASYLLSLMDRLCLLSILFSQSKNVALGHTVRSLVFGSLCQ
ncbi:MAG: hypothetical protein EZS28_041715 [Streblomastix strix]|uniref:Uncharacterized protein n=1 Tax=Streblomastix strix TaxID=222440 RepID=A0A5J4TXE4_9EUKA|nr:MAG: hypothetical protein EZS28_041715 [Streblomastix strix]